MSSVTMKTIEHAILSSLEAKDVSVKTLCDHRDRWPGVVFVAVRCLFWLAPPDWGTRSLVAWPKMTLLFFAALRLQALTFLVCYGMR